MSNEELLVDKIVELIKKQDWDSYDLDFFRAELIELLNEEKNKVV